MTTTPTLNYFPLLQHQNSRQRTRDPPPKHSELSVIPQGPQAYVPIPETETRNSEAPSPRQGINPRPASLIALPPPPKKKKKNKNISCRLAPYTLTTTLQSSHKKIEGLCLTMLGDLASNKAAAAPEAVFHQLDVVGFRFRLHYLIWDFAFWGLYKSGYIVSYGPSGLITVLVYC